MPKLKPCRQTSGLGCEGVRKDLECRMSMSTAQRSTPHFTTVHKADATHTSPTAYLPKTLQTLQSKNARTTLKALPLLKVQGFCDISLVQGWGLIPVHVERDFMLNPAPLHNNNALSSTEPQSVKGSGFRRIYPNNPCITPVSISFSI